MADALCGPSNALSSFQKHSQADRTLQQDRLISRQSPGQGFRSKQGLNVGILDPEFEAFQAGHLASPLPQFEGQPFAPQNHVHFAPQQRPALPDWASDFQRLHIASPRPASSHQSQAHALQSPVARHSPQASWHQDFLQSQPMANTFQQQPQAMFQSQQAFPDYSWGNGQMNQMSSIAQGKQRAEEPQTSQFDAAAFAAAFDAATQDAVAEDSIAAEIQADRDEVDFLVAKEEAKQTTRRQRGGQISHLTGMDLSSDIRTDMAQDSNDSLSWPLHQEATHDNVNVIDDIMQDLSADADTQGEEKMQPPAVDEELARTAGQLLQSVSHETSQKFQDSVFLQLMRRIRDKEVKVEGEHFVETGSSTASMDDGLSMPILIPELEQDLDLGRFGSEEPEEPQTVEPDFLVLPSRPLTPEIDPPAPIFADWRRALWEGLDHYEHQFVA